MARAGLEEKNFFTALQRAENIFHCGFNGF
jgi:hypothetical protein